MKTIQFAATLSALGLAVATLVACGGGGSSASTAGAASVRVSTYITDNLATDYSQVWVGVLRITAIDAATGAETVLFSADAPTVFNLAALASVGQLMSSLAIPAGNYSHVKVTLADAVKLVSLDGKTTTSASFNGNGTPIVVPIRVDFDTASSARMVLDFNLAKFTLDGAGHVVPAIERRTDEKTQPFMREQAVVRGAVVSVDAHGFVMNDKRLGDGVVVTLASDAVIFEEATHKVLVLSDLKAGLTIEVKGLVTPAVGNGDPVKLTAAIVRVVDASGETLPGVSKFAGGEGRITAIAGSVITVALNEATVLPGAQGSSIDVDTAHAVYTHGAASDLALGTAVGFRGTLAGDGHIAALFVDVEGAPSKTDRDANPNLRFADLQAVVVGLAGNTLTVTANPGEGTKGSTQTSYTVDIGHTGYKNWGAQCLTAGQHIEVKGALAGNALTALLIEIEGGCLSASPPAPPVPPAPPASGASSPI